MTSYIQSLDIGEYIIKTDTVTYDEANTRFNTITPRKGFYTPNSLIRRLQSEFDKNQYPCTFSLMNKTGDENGQVF